MSASLVEFTDTNWQAEVLDSSLPVLVDFWAPWCGPCRMLSPTIEKIAGQYTGKVKVGKMNTDDNPNTPSQLQISSIPTVLVYKDGSIVDKLVGVSSEAKLKDALAKAGVA